MYSKKEAVEPYVDLMFPQQVVAKFIKTFCVPTFHTFVSTDDAGFQSYYHTLIYYEQVSKDSIINDFDTKKAAEKLRNEERRRQQEKNRYASRANRASTSLSQSSRNSTTLETDENTEEEMAFEYKAPRLNVQKIQVCPIKQ